MIRLFHSVILFIPMFCNLYGQQKAGPKDHNYLFFFHNRFTEDMPLEAQHVD